MPHAGKVRVKHPLAKNRLVKQPLASRHQAVDPLAADASVAPDGTPPRAISDRQAVPQSHLQDAVSAVDVTIEAKDTDFSAQSLLSFSLCCGLVAS